MRSRREVAEMTSREGHPVSRRRPELAQEEGTVFQKWVGKWEKSSPFLPGGG